jgi:ribose transport system substrate-binding protein
VKGTPVNRTTALTAAGLLLVALPLAACTSSKPAEPAQQGQPAGGATTAPTAAASSMAAPAKASKNYNLQFIQGVAGDEFYITMNCGMQAEAAKLGVSVKPQGGQKFDPTVQKPVLDSVVASKPDAILIAPTDVTAMQAPLNAAAGAGIKIVLVDTTVEDPSIAVSAIASDNEGGGRAAFEAIKQLNPNGGKVMIMSVNPGISTTDARAKGFEDAVKEDSKFQYLGVQYSRMIRPQRQISWARRSKRTPTSLVSSPPTCSPQKARPPVFARPGRGSRSRSSVSTPAQTRLRL